MFFVLSFIISGCATKMHTLSESVSTTETAPSWQISEYKIKPEHLIDFNKHSELKRYISQVIDNNSDIKSISATVKAAKNEVDATQSGSRPQADLELSLTHNKDRLNTASANLAVSWVLDIWGKLSNEVQAVRYISEKSQYDLSQTKRALIVQAAQSWVEYWGHSRNQNQLVQLNHINTLLLEHYQEGYTSGLAPYEFMLNARKRKKTGRNHLWRVQLEAKKLLHYMNTVRGRPVADQLKVTNGQLSSELVAFIGKISATTLFNRPDILAAFAEVRAFELSADAAHKALLPQVNLTGSALKSGTSLNDALNGDLVWQFIGGLTQPIFNAGQLKTIAKRKSAEAEASWWQYQHVVLNAIREVEDAMAGDKQLAQQLAQKQAMLNDLTKKIDSIEERFSDGDLTLAELFLVQIEKIEAEIEMIDTEVAYIKNRLALIAALGLPIETLWEASSDAA